MNVAIPKLNNLVAPCFEAAKQFEIIAVEQGHKVSSKTVICDAGEGFKRVRLLRLHDVTVLICNGIKGFYRDQLLAMGLEVVPNINDTVEQAFTRYIKGELKDSEAMQDDSECTYYDVSHNDLVSWAREYFETNGYRIFSGPGRDSFLIDLIAEIKCPLCNKSIRVAVCCGAQTYRTDQEIKEFHHSARSQYNARVYVYLENPKIARCCDEYGIEFIGADRVNLNHPGSGESKIPILRRKIEGHEKAFITQE